MAHSFLVHNEGDHVGVAVREVAPDGLIDGVLMDTNGVVQLRALDPIPLGHKIALVDLEPDAQVIEYGVRIGIATQPIKQGQHVHTHNIRSARW